MTKNKVVESLEARVDELKAELKKTISEIVSIKSAPIVKEYLTQYGITGKVATLSWDFYPEGDDEGGTVWYPESIELEVDGNYIEMEDYEVSRKSKYSDSVYAYTLGEDMNEFLSDLSSKLHEAYVTSLTIDLENELEEN